MFKNTYLTVLFIVYLIFSYQIIVFAQIIESPGSIFFEQHRINKNSTEPLKSSYTLQSNGTPQQIWVDLINPDFLHAVFTISEEGSPWNDRHTAYLGSFDGGNTWMKFGQVPSSGRSGFASITHNLNGAAVITNHSDFFYPPDMRTALFIDNSPFENNFTAYDPGPGQTFLWPKCTVAQNGNIIVAAGNILAVNTFIIDSSKFTGWSIIAESTPEGYSISASDGGKIGLAFLGGAGPDDGDVFYIETTDNGLTWLNPPQRIFDCPAEQGIAMGALRGISLTFLNESPSLVFEICEQDFNTLTYHIRKPNEIIFWNPDVNGGVPKVIADSNNVPFAQALTNLEVFAPLSRPVISRTEDNQLLLVAFSAATENVFPAMDSLTYFAGYFMYSFNGGEEWNMSGKFTPDEPLRDWKYISMPNIQPYVVRAKPNKSIGYEYDIHIVVQSDSLIANPIIPTTAEYYHFCSVPPFVNVDEDINVINQFRLEQNYPNPFNPSTKIKYSLADAGYVTLKIYDVLGNEVTTLVNTEQNPGIYELDFNASHLTSGVYFYTLTAKEFVQTKKLVLIK